MMAVQMPSRLYRSRSQKMIAGVSGGLGEYFDVDPVLIRLLFVVTAFISGAGILAYIVLWIVVPLEGDDSPRMDALRRDFDDISSRVRDHIDPWGGPSRPASPTASANVGSAAPAPGSSAAEPAASSGEPATSSAANPDAGLVDDPLELPREPSEPAATSERPNDEPRSHADSGPETAGPGAAYGPPGPDPAWYAGSMPGAYDQASAPPADRRRRRQHWAGAILILVGLLVLGNNLGLLRWAEPAYVVPLILVVAGSWLLFGRNRRG
jgi:phage shock protein C